MINVTDLIALFQKANDEKWGYIWGARGEVWTQEAQDDADRDMTKKYGAKWIGKRVADCSGLFAWAFKELGGYMYHGSNTMWSKYCVRQGELPYMDIRAGTAVFKTKEDNDRYHVGLYIGNGNVIEAKGTPYGVVQSKLTEWDEWGELQGISYESNDYPTLSKGARGDSSEKLQNALNDKGFDCGDVDGIFGAKTLSAVKQFQEAKGLIVDGICGQNTWRALLEEDTETLTLEARVIALENKVQALEKYIKGEQQNGTTMG